MRALIAILAGLFGGVIGYIGSAFLAFAILGGGGPGDSGGTAMGIFFSIAPLGAVAGAIAGVVLSLRATRRDPPDDTGSEEGATETEPTDGAEAQAAARKSGGGSTQALIAFGVIGAIIAGIYYAFFYEYVPPNFRNSARSPRLMFEVKVPTKAISEDDYFKVRGELRSWQHVLSPDGGLMRRTEDGFTILSGTFHMYNKVDDRKFWLYPSQRIFLEFNLPYEAVPEAEADFSPWRQADRREVHASQAEVYLIETSEALLRTRVVWPN